MKITWLGHSGFRIDIADKVLLIDPWFTGNPVFPNDRRSEAIAGSTHILVTHAHGDHAADAPAISSETGAQIICVHELSEIWKAEGVTTTGMGKGGTLDLGQVTVTMVNAVHSSSIDYKDAIQYAGEPAGFMIKGDGHTIYVSGDTDVMADMEWMADLYKPDIGILCCGGHYTMDMAGAAYAAKRYFTFSTVIPCHYKTFGLLAQSAQPIIDALPGVDVMTPEVMETIEF